VTFSTNAETADTFYYQLEFNGQLRPRRQDLHDLKSDITWALSKDRELEEVTDTVAEGTDAE
jgi:hypothetical protein